MAQGLELRDGEIYLEIYEFLEAANGNPLTYRFNIRTQIDNKVVGRCSFRVGNTDNRHIKYGGNIGYNVYEKYRGNKYSLKACRLLLILAKYHGMEAVYITCDPANMASRRICELLGAAFITILNLPEDDYNYVINNIKHHCLYKMTL